VSVAALLCLAGAVDPQAWGAEVQTLTLEQCIATALERNRLRPASRLAVAAAEAQYRQARSGYWPQLGLAGGYERMDEAPNFVFPASTLGIPPQTISVPPSSFNTDGMVITIPAGAFGPGFPPQDVQVPLPPQTIDLPGQSLELPAQHFRVPEQDVRLADPDSWYATINARWLLWDGGLRKGIGEQARAGLDVAREELRRTELEIVDSVTRLYYGAVLARQVLQVGTDTLARMEATLSLTEALYTEGAGRVRKTDFLDNTIMVEALRSAVALLESHQTMAQAALAYTIGLGWNDSVVPADDEIAFEPIDADPEQLVHQAWAFSPDWKRVEAGIRAAEGALREARSGHYPKIAMTGELHRWWNGYDAGLATDTNKEGWTAGIGMRLPLFQGFATREKVREARARLDQRREESLRLREGVGLRVRQLLVGLDTAEKRYRATLAAMTAATESRALNTRAYQNELVETRDVVRAQLVEALMSAQHYRMLLDHAELRSQLSLVVGTEVSHRWTGGE
jgi:outer membrane protein TolC